MRWKPVLHASVAIFAVLLLGSSTCGVVGSTCREVCNPCVEQCQCTSACSQGLSFEAAHRLVRYEMLEVPEGRAGLLRIYAHIQGLALVHAFGPGEYGGEEMSRFALDVLNVNAELFGVELSGTAREWTLTSVEMYGTAGVVTFHQESPSASDDSRPFHSTSATFLFDARGELVEIDLRTS